MTPAVETMILDDGDLYFESAIERCNESIMAGVRDWYTLGLHEIPRRQPMASIAIGRIPPPRPTDRGHAAIYDMILACNDDHMLWPLLADMLEEAGVHVKVTRAVRECKENFFEAWLVIEEQLRVPGGWSNGSGAVIVPWDESGGTLHVRHGYLRHEMAY